LLIEREKFPPRESVRRCLNPPPGPCSRASVSRTPSARCVEPLRSVEFADARGRHLRFQLPDGPRANSASDAVHLDALLLESAKARGAEVCEGTAVERIVRDGTVWRITAGERTFTARMLVAADGRNSTVARLLESSRCRQGSRGLARPIFPPRRNSTGASSCDFCPVATAASRQSATAC